MKYPCTNLSLSLLGNHTLIGGTTGSGKSVLMKDIIFTLEVKGIEYSIIDLKRVSLIEYIDSAQRYASTYEKALELLDSYLRLMDNRFKEMERRRIDLYDGKECYLIIDECADLIHSEDAKRDALIKAKLTKLMREARASKIYIIYATQNPSRDVLTASIVQNIPNRIALRCLSNIEYRQILGQVKMDALPCLQGLYGQAYVLTPNDLTPKVWKVFMREKADIYNMLRGERHAY